MSCVAAGCCRPLKVERRSGQLLQLLALQLLLTCWCCLQVCHVQATGSRQQTNLPEHYVT